MACQRRIKISTAMLGSKLRNLNVNFRFWKTIPSKTVPRSMRYRLPWIDGLTLKIPCGTSVQGICGLQMVTETLLSSIKKLQTARKETPSLAFVTRRDNGRRMTTPLRPSSWSILKIFSAQMGIQILQCSLMRSNQWLQKRWILFWLKRSWQMKSTKPSSRCIPKNLQAPMVCLPFFINIFGLLQVSMSPKLFLIFWTMVLYYYTSKFQWNTHCPHTQGQKSTQK